jgi:hypothetical protein
MKKASDIPTTPGERRWKALTQQARAALQTTLDEMQDYFDQRSENWQEGDKGLAVQDRLEALEEILGLVDELFPAQGAEGEGAQESE